MLLPDRVDWVALVHTAIKILRKERGRKARVSRNPFEFHAFVHSLNFTLRYLYILLQTPFMHFHVTRAQVKITSP